jgi:hypothetical protein
MRHALLTLAVASATALSLLPRPAEACGGFFCMNTPVDQSGEQIVFNMREGGVDAHVQIQYVGEAQDFAWVVPVLGVPTLAVGAPTFFTYLSNVTRPRFQLTWEPDNCGMWERDVAFSSGPPSADAGTSEGGGGVQVLAQGAVGPYDTVILAANDRELLAKWLSDNGYNLTDPTALDPYVGHGYNFVALKLQKDRAVGELRPIVLRFEGSRPCIPIRLTAVAARPDMPITAYVFSQKRAIPINYRHVLVNEARLDWLAGGQNYNQVASRAVDEAGGQAFLTEFAGATTPFKNPPEWQLPGQNLNAAALAQNAHPVDFVLAIFSQGFPAGDGALMALLQKHVPVPKSLETQVSPQQFYNSISSYRADIDNDPGRAPFDPQAFAADLDEAIIVPLKEARQILLDRPYLTRLYTTMSAEEMTVDPEFEFNPDAPDVSNVHGAKAKRMCSVGGNLTGFEITLANGIRFRLGPDGEPVSEGPNAARIEQYTESGEPALIRDNSKEIEDLLSRVAPAGGCGCAATGLSPLLGLGLFGLWAARRRRTSGR